MPALPRREVVAETLRIVNQARGASNLPLLVNLPKGRRNDQFSCVIAYALGDAGVFMVRNRNLLCENQESARRIAESWGTTPSGLALLNVELPEAAQQFVYEFDEGVFPTLVTRKHRSVA